MDENNPKEGKHFEYLILVGGRNYSLIQGWVRFLLSMLGQHCHLKITIVFCERDIGSITRDENYVYDDGGFKLCRIVAI